MQIHGSSHVHGPHSLKGPYSNHTNGARPTARANATGDQFEISAAAEAAAQAVETGDIRADLVNRVRNEIAAGTYDTPGKFEAAMERLLDDVV
ncbi:flagellar biosynthesis anti-sigma factor FlgM [Bythopirellula polymerisocia]|uniref:Anti-sigma-28 factor FlgM C-terminal domain-containing protein n=1 Tax=Bythopirellula polymerisocia TaxID=2528003 RepID=A0A5C6CKU5_9BACT|nr:flagellar biosynthesis anti-sigma factor FlgM [Bythopirellula polymerisocia]TWU23746.1 hypothetical protein Pla144_39210 [Bythopirellula polymerisocia]